MKNFNIEFGGFYCSIHDQLIDSMLDSYYDDQDYSDLNIDYSAIFTKYSKQYLLFLKEHLFEAYSLQFRSRFKELLSPREYNFSTDKINVDLNDLDAKNIIKAFKNNASFLAYLQEATVSRSGYISFYSFNDAIADKDGILLTFIFYFICQHNSLIIDLWLQYYDFNNVYEILYSMDLPQLEGETV